MADPVSAAIIIGVNIAATVALNELQDPVEVGKVDELRGNLGGEGTPYPICYGQECPVPGVPIAFDRDTQKTSSGGGIVGTKVDKYYYKANMAVGWCDTNGTAIDRVVKVWANDRLIFDADADITVTSSVLTVEAYTQTVDDGAGGTITLRTIQIVRSAATNIDLSQFYPGRDVVVTNFNNSANNGTFRCIQAKRTSATETEVWLANPNAATCASGCGTDITLYQDIPEFYNNDIRGIDNDHKGNSTQTADSYLEDIFGSGEVETFRGIAYTVFDRLKLKHYGSSIPTLRALIDTKGSAVTLDEVVDDIIARIEKSQRELGYPVSITADTTGLASVTVRGFVFIPPITPIEMLQKLAAAYNLAVQDTGNGLRFFLRENATEIAIDTDDLAAHAFGEDYARPSSGLREVEARIPTEVSVQFLDPEQEYTKGSAKETRQRANEINVRTLDLTGVFTDDEAKAIAARMLWVAEATQNKKRLSLPAKYWRTLENDALTWTDGASHNWRVLVDRIDRRFDWALDIEAIEDHPAALNFTRTASDKHLSSAQRIPAQPEMDLQVFECGPIDYEDALVPTLYMATAPFDSNFEFLGAVIYRSTDNILYQPLQYVDVPSTVGYTSGTLADVPAVVEAWDEVNTLTVIMHDGEALTSATEAEVLQERRNWARVGREIIAFRTVVDNGNNSYTLSGLLRGLLNTGDRAPEHTANEPFAMLVYDPIIKLTVPTTDIGKTIYYKSVAYGEDASNVDFVLSHTITGETVKPWAPNGIIGYKADFSGTTSGLRIEWTPRTRAPVTLLGPKPVIDDIERYRVQPLDMLGGTVIDTYTINDRDYHNYTDAAQSGDGWTDGDPVRMAQYSEILEIYGDSSEAEVG